MGHLKLSRHCLEENHQEDQSARADLQKIIQSLSEITISLARYSDEVEGRGGVRFVLHTGLLFELAAGRRPISKQFPLRAPAWAGRQSVILTGRRCQISHRALGTKFTSNSLTSRRNLIFIRCGGGGNRHGRLVPTNYSL